MASASSTPGMQDATTAAAMSSREFAYFLTTNLSSYADGTTMKAIAAMPPPAVDQFINATLKRAFAARVAAAPGRNIAAHVHESMQEKWEMLSDAVKMQWSSAFAVILNDVLNTASNLSRAIRGIVAPQRAGAAGCSFIATLLMFDLSGYAGWNDALAALYAELGMSVDGGAGGEVAASGGGGSSAAVAGVDGGNGEEGELDGWNHLHVLRMMLHMTMFSVYEDAHNGYFTASLRLAFASYSSCFFGSILALEIVHAGWLTEQQLIEHALCSLRNKAQTHVVFKALFSPTSAGTVYTLRVEGFDDIEFTTRPELIESIAYLRQHRDSSHRETTTLSWDRALQWVESFEEGSGTRALLCGGRSWSIHA